MTDKDDLRNSTMEKDLASDSEVHRVSKLIADIKRIASGQPVGAKISEKVTTIDLEPLKEENLHQDEQESISIKDPSIDSNTLYLKIKNDLNYLVRDYLEEARPNPQRVEILGDFDKILSNINSGETEINIPTILSAADTKRVEDLFLLLEEEITSKTKKVRVDQIPISATTVLSRTDLEAVFEELSEKIIEEVDLVVDSPIISSEEIPYATLSNIFFAFLFDVLVFLGLSIYAVSEYTGDNLAVSELRLFVVNHLALISMFFFGIWFSIQAISLIVVQGSFGQSMTGIVVVTKNNKIPSIPRLISRLSLHFLNFISLGLYSAVLVNFFLAKNQYGIYCPISKTKLTFSSFVKA